MKKLLNLIIGKPQQLKFTNFHSHAAVTGLFTTSAILVLNHINVPYSEFISAVACTVAVTIQKEGLTDTVWDWGDVIANATGATAVAVFMWMLS